MAQYGKASYWDERYTKDPEPFDWYQRYTGVKDLIAQYVKKEDNILNVGAGNSRLTEDMYEDGYQAISNIDISKVCIDSMAEKYKDKTGLTWQYMNCMQLDFPDENFDVVMDKGTIDSILCGEGSTANSAKMMNEISRALKPMGVYFCISYGVPENRLSYLENEEYKWKVTVHTVPKPTVSAAAAPEAKEGSNMHYIYVCQKGVDQGRRVKD